MMEPVAWMVKTRMGNIAWATWQPAGEPLVRLSDAEARIKELEAKLSEADALIEAQQHDFAQNNIRNAENAHRAEAAEALLKEQEAKIDRLMLFGGRMANACYNIGQKPKPSHMDMVDLLFAQAEWDKAVRAARAIHHKIGVKDE